MHKRAIALPGRIAEYIVTNMEVEVKSNMEVVDGGRMVYEPHGGPFLDISHEFTKIEKE